MVRDLLGPAGGPEEEIDEAPRERYLLGMLAPRRQILGQEMFGLTFAVDGGTAALRVRARWGRYEWTRSAVGDGEKEAPLVTLFLVNGQQEQKRRKDAS